MKDFTYLRQTKKYRSTSLKIPFVVFLFSIFSFWTTQAQTYCTPNSFSGGCSQTMIDDFTLEGENGTAIEDLSTGCSSGEYDDRTGSGETVDLLPGEYYDADVVSNSTTVVNDYAVMWIDFDNDGNFDNSDRVGYVDNTVSTYPGGTGSYYPGAPLEIYIPINASPGQHRMRVMIGSNGDPSDSDQYNPCNNGSSPRAYGEIHDYNITILNPPSCPKPRLLDYNNVTDHSVDITWTPDGSETKWELIYGEHGFDPNTDGNSENINGTPKKTINNLDENTRYDVYIKAICSSSDNSDLVGPITFITVCSSNADVPFSLDFEDAIIPDIPNCGSTEVITGNEFATIDMALDNVDGFSDTALYYTSNNTSEDADSWYFTKGINLKAGVPYTISYEYGSYQPFSSPYYVERFEVSYGTSASASAMNQLADYPQMDVMEATADEVTFQVSSDDVYYFGFHAYSTKDDGFMIYIDNIYVDEACPSPSNITVSNIDETSAEINWNAGESETEWNVIYGEDGFDPTTDGQSVNINGNPETTLTNLDPNTDYNVYIEAVCDDTNNITSALAGPEIFTTTDMSVANQKFENFKYYPNPVRNQLNLNSGKIINSITLYDLSGKNLIELNPNSLSTQINTQNIQAGIYLMRVNIEGSHKTFRIIKK